MLFQIFQKKKELRPTIELEPKLLTTGYLLATIEVIIFNLPFFPGKPMQNAFIEDWPQGVLCFKLLIECDGSFLIALFLAFFEKKKIIRETN